MKVVFFHACLLSATASPWSDVTSIKAGVATAFLPNSIACANQHLHNHIENQIIHFRAYITTRSMVLTDTLLQVFP